MSDRDLFDSVVKEFVILTYNSKRYGGYNNHVLSSKYANVVVRFEDLIDRPLDKLREIVFSLGYEINDETLLFSIDAQSFAKRKRNELDNRLMRTGTKDDYKKYLNQENMDLVKQLFHVVFEKFYSELLEG